MARVFFRVKCEHCRNEQIIYSRPASAVHCVVCGALLAQPAGGEGRLVAKVIQVLE